MAWLTHRSRRSLLILSVLAPLAAACADGAGAPDVDVGVDAGPVDDHDDHATPRANQRRVEPPRPALSPAWTTRIPGVTGTIGVNGMNPGDGRVTVGANGPDGPELIVLSATGGDIAERIPVPKLDNALAVAHDDGRFLIAGYSGQTPRTVHYGADLEGAGGACDFNPANGQVGTFDDIYVGPGQLDLIYGPDSILSINCGNGGWYDLAGNIDHAITPNEVSYSLSTGFTEATDLPWWRRNAVRIVRRKYTGHHFPNYPTKFHVGEVGGRPAETNGVDIAANASASALFIGGTTHVACATSPIGCATPFLARMNADATLAWTYVDPDGSKTVSQVLAGPDGTAWMIGARTGGLIDVRRHDGDTGALQGELTFSVRGELKVSVVQAAISPSGVVYVAGNVRERDGSTKQDVFIAAISSSGGLLGLNFLGDAEQNDFLRKLIVAGTTVYVGAVTTADPDAGVAAATVVAKYGSDRDADGIVDDDEVDEAAKDRKDLYVEVDYMVAPYDKTELQDALNLVAAKFAVAPVANPKGGDGITLHIELDDAIEPRTFGCNAADDDDECHKKIWAGFDEIKGAHFGDGLSADDKAKRERNYHYAIFAIGVVGRAKQETGLGEVHGNDFLMMLGNASVRENVLDQMTREQRVNAYAGTFMHELGHNLGLNHGGRDTDLDNFKPNYHSVMNYAWQMQFFRDAGLTDSWRLDYSREEFPAIDETAFDEALGFTTDVDHASHKVVACNLAGRQVAVNESGPVDLDGAPGVAPYQIDLNCSDKSSNGDNKYTILWGHNDWPAIDLRGAGMGGHWTGSSHGVSVDELDLTDLEVLHGDCDLAGPVPGCGCIPGDTQPCGSIAACALGTQTCGDDFLFGACEDLVTSTDEAPCTSAGCDFTVAATLALGHRGEPVAITIGAEHPACAWAATVPAAAGWLTVEQVGGAGDATLTVQATVNPTATARTATLIVAGKAVTVTQAGDTEPPTGTLVVAGGALATKTSPVPFAITGIDANGVSEMCVGFSTNCTAWVPFATAIDVVKSNSGSNTFTGRVLLRDALGNTSGWITDEIVWDVTAPQNPQVVAVPGDAVVTLSWTAAVDLHSNVASYRVVFGTGDTAPPCSGTVAGVVTGLGFVHTGLTNGTTYRYRVCPIDAVGNVGSGDTVSSRPAPEHEPPTGVSVVIDGGAEWSTSSEVTATLTASDPSGVTSVCLSPQATCTAWKPFATTRTTMLADGSGTRTLNAWFRDAWGNVTPAPVSDTIKVDRTKPADGDELTATPGDGTVALSWLPATDGGSGVAGYRLVAVTSSAAPTCNSPVIYAGLATDFVHAPVINGTTYKYRVCALDVAGNVSTGVAATALPAPEHDAPTGTIVINGGATITGSGVLALALTASDASGVPSMCLSTTSTCSTWGSFAATKSLNVGTTSGTKTVNVWFRDTWNHVSDKVSASIVLDVTGPADGALTATPGAAGQVALDWTAATDALSTVASYKVVVGTGTLSSKCTNGTVVATGAALSASHTGTTGTTYKYRVCAVDQLGNVSTGATATAVAP